MKTVRVDLEGRGYDICIGQDVDPGVFFEAKQTRKAMIVTDTNVEPLYGGVCKQRLRACGIEAPLVAVPAGEPSKSLATLECLYSRAIEHGLDRTSALVALGGGVVGDLAGFTAATYMRGIAFVQVPTTLLAMVDSSVGGKTGVNLEQGKNLVGAFHQPAGVAADLGTLLTLPEREYAAGLAEVVKYGVIRDADLFEQLERSADKLVRRDLEVLEECIARCCRIKAAVVVADERESGEREILNFGHTFGHALEQTSGYGRLLHGEAVAAGMMYAARLSAATAGLGADELQRLQRLLDKLGLPTRLPADSADWPALRAAMGTDKKSRNQNPRLVLAESIGCCRVGCEVDEKALQQVWEKMLATA